jgi:uncharacterized membrane protein (UPF0182 family)
LLNKHIKYYLSGHTQQVNLSARELNINKIPEAAKSWENIHLRYTHGYGAVVTPAAQDAGKPIVWYLRDLNMHSDVELAVETPDIYYGEEKYTYAIVPNKLDILGLSDSGQDVNSSYKGGAGIPKLTCWV